MNTIADRDNFKTEGTVSWKWNEGIIERKGCPFPVAREAKARKCHMSVRYRNNFTYIMIETYSNNDSTNNKAQNFMLKNMSYLILNMTLYTYFKYLDTILPFQRDRLSIEKIKLWIYFISYEKKCLNKSNTVTITALHGESRAYGSRSRAVSVLF